MNMPTLYGCQFAQPALPGLCSLVYPTPRRSTLGRMGEITVEKALKAAGYQVRQGRRHEGDLHVIDRGTGQVLFVEVKTAMRSVDRKWRFTLFVRGKTDYRHSDVVVLLAVLDDFTYVPFAIPVPDLSDRSQLCITSHPATYAGWLAAYRLSPTAVDLLPGVVEKPLSERNAP